VSVKKVDESKLSVRAKAASVALAELQRSVRFFRLYPHDHPLCTGAVGESLDRINRFVERQGALEVEVQRDGLYLDDEVVLRDSDQSTDLSSLLFPEGIREVSIDPGIGHKELGDFISIMSAHYPEGEEVTFTTDLLTELWRRDFAHIEYRIYDQLAPSAVTANRDPTVAQVADRIVDLVDRIGGKPGAAGTDPSNEGLDVDKFLGELEAAQAEGSLDELANWATRPEKVDAYLESSLGRARKQLLHELVDPHQGDPLGRALDVVVWAAPVESGPAPDDVARFVAGSTMAALAKGDVEKAMNTLSRLPEGTAQADAIAKTIAGRLGSDHGLSLLTTALAEKTKRLGPQELMELGTRYLSRLQDAAVPGACQLYPTVESEPVRRVLREYLSGHLDVGAEAIAAITKADDRKIVEEAASMLASGKRDSRAWKLLQEAASDTLHAVRSAVATDVIDTVTGEKQRRERVRQLTRSTSKAERLAALTELAERPTSKLFEELCTIALDAEFALRDEDEVQAVLGLVVRIGQLRAVRVLTELSGRKAGLFGRKEIGRVAVFAKEHLDALRGAGR
jgi:hypothetical protein